jgi:chemotaxis protein CheZ
MDTNVPQPHGGADVSVRLQVIAEQLAQEVSRLSELQVAKTAEQHLSTLRNELESMGHLIANTRCEIASVLPMGASNSYLTSATDELDAVVSATERAAVEIMVAAEHTQQAVQRMRQVSLPAEVTADLDTIDGAVMDVFMACSFQDLTGQRIRKVVQALAYIEQRVISLSTLWHGPGEVPAGPGVPAWETREDAHLLNGPSNAGLQQDAIDALLDGNAPTGTSSQDDVDALFA